MDINVIAMLITEDPDVINELIDIDRYGRFDVLDIARKFVANQKPTIKNSEWARTYKIMGNTFVQFIKKIAYNDQNKIMIILKYLAELPDGYIIKTLGQYKNLKEKLIEKLKSN